MKRIIEGAKYDTETAKFIGSDSFSNSGDFNHWSEKLYRTKSGKYFLHGEGGPMSRYSRVVGQNEWCGGEKIIPLDRAGAMKWAEEHLGADQYEEAFGEVTDDGTEQLNITIPAALKARLWEMAEQQKTSVSALAEEILKKALE